MVEYGTPTAGRPVYAESTGDIPRDPSKIQTPYYEAGWFPETLTGNIRPYAEDMNGVFYVHSYNLAYLLQAGIPEWNADTPYFPDCVVRVGRILYVSRSNIGTIDDVNKGNPPSDGVSNQFWDVLTLGDAGIPVGASLEWNSNTLPEPSYKWRFENGDTVNSKDYPELWNVIGHSFGYAPDVVIDGTTYKQFKLPNSTKKVAIGYASGELSLATTGGQFNHQHVVPAHYHGKGNISISNSGEHSHPVSDSGHIHAIPDHQHLFRFGDYSTKAGNDVARLACLGSTGSGTSDNPTKVAWNAQNGKEKFHFYKMVSKQVPNGGTIDQVGARLNTSIAQSGTTISSSNHSHTNASISGNIGAVNGVNADTGTMQTKSLDTNDYSSNMPFIVKRKIIRVLK